MARIPESITNDQYTQDAPSLMQRNVSSPDQFGAGVAKGLDRFAEIEFRLGQEKRQDEEETAVLAAYNKANSERSKLLYDPEHGLYSRSGMDARDLATKFDSQGKLIGESASVGLSGKAKQKFDQMWIRSSQSDREGLMRYELGQRQKNRVDTGNATIDLAVTNAVNDYSNPETIARSKSEIMGAVMSTFKGASQEQLREEILKGYSALHRGVIMQLSVQSPSLAEKYFADNRGDMVASDHVAVSNHLRGQIFKSNVAKNVERITSTGGPVRELFNAIKQEDEALGRIMESVTSAESSFRARVETKNYNKAGEAIPEKTAVGLTQVLVSTAREISRDIGDGLMEGKSTDEVKELLKDPVLNLRYGAHYLTKQLAKYGGDVEAALIAYNAGPGNADKFIAAGRDYSVLPDRNQTEPYVAKIMAMLHRNVQETPYTRTAQNLSQAGVSVSATDAERTDFRAATKSGTPGVELTPPVENGAARLWADMPDLVKYGLTTMNSGGNLMLTPGDAFAKDWILYNADNYGLNAVDQEGNVLLTDGNGPSQAIAIMDEKEYDLDKWLAEAEQIEDPTVREATIQGLMRRHAALQKAAKQDENSLKQQAWEIALKGEEIPVELKRKLTPSYVSSIEEYQKKVASGTKITTNWETWATLRRMSDEELQNIGDVMQYRNSLADTEFKQLVDMVRDVRGDATPDKKGLSSVLRTRAAIVSDTVKEHFKNDKARIGKLNRALDERVDAYFTAYQKVPTPVELQTMVDRLIMQGSVEGKGFLYGSGTEYLFEVNPGDFLSAPIVNKEDDIPPTARASAGINAIDLIGRRFTPSEMLWTYTAALAHTRGAYVSAPLSLKKAIMEKSGAPESRVNEVYGRIAADIFGVK
jgi:hypothetical protein